MDLAPHYWRLAQWRGMRASVLLHPPLDPRHFPSRKELAQAAWQAVADGASLLRQNRPVPAESAARGRAGRSRRSKPEPRRAELLDRTTCRSATSRARARKEAVPPLALDPRSGGSPIAPGLPAGSARDRDARPRAARESQAGAPGRSLPGHALDDRILPENPPPPARHHLGLPDERVRQRPHGATCWRRSATRRPRSPSGGRHGDPQHLPYPRPRGGEGVLRARPAARAQGGAGGGRRADDPRRRRLRRAGRGRGDPRPRALRRSRARAADLSPPARDGRARRPRGRGVAIDTDFPPEPKFDFLPDAEPRRASPPSSPSRRAATSSAPSASCPTRAAPRRAGRPRPCSPRRGAWWRSARARSRCSGRT